MTREEAIDQYVDLVIKRGNPSFFIWAVARNWSDDWIEECLEADFGVVVEIEEEE